MKFGTGANESAAAARRSQERAARPENRLRIDGRFLNHEEIALEVGVSSRKIGLVLRELRGASGAITMERIRAASRRSA